MGKSADANVKSVSVVHADTEHECISKLTEIHLPCRAFSIQFRQGCVLTTLETNSRNKTAAEISDSGRRERRGWGTCSEGRITCAASLFRFRHRVALALQPCPKPWATFVCGSHLFCYVSEHWPQTALAYARVWHQVDASERVLGKLAERIALVLMGKHKPIYDPSGKPMIRAK
jgi:hypothetical protein